MKNKVLITIENNKMRACSNGEIEIYVEHMDALNGIEQIAASEITNEDFNQLLKGKGPDVIL
jgi:hypothetical protein